MRRNLVPAWVSWLVAIAGIGILVAIIARAGVPTGSLNLTPASVVVLLVSQAAFLVTESLRMQSVLQEAAGMRFGTIVMFRIFVIARILNFIVPQAGNVYRIASLKDEYNAPIIETTGGLVSFVWISVTASLCLSTVLSFFTESSDSGLVSATPSVMAVITALAIFLPGIILALASRLRSENSILIKVRRGATAALEILRRPRALIRFIGFWALSLIVIVIMYSAVFSMVGTVPSVATLVAIYALVQATTFVVITPGNIGIQDVGFAAIAIAFGSEPVVAAAAALIVRVSGVAVTALVGLVVVVASSRGTAD